MPGKDKSSDGDNNSAAPSRNTTRKCLDEITRNIATLLAQQGILEKTFERVYSEHRAESLATRGELADIHERISSIRDNMTQIRMDLTEHISYSKGTKAVWRGFSGPILAGVGTGIGALLVWVGTKLAVGG